MAIALVAVPPAQAAPSVPEMALEIVPGPSGAHPYDITPFKGGLLFFANDGVHGFELWRYQDGKAQMVTDIKPGLSSSEGHALKVVGNNAFFVANDGPMVRSSGAPTAHPPGH